MAQLTKEKEAARANGAIDHEFRRDHTTEGIDNELAILGYNQELVKNRSMYTILFQSLAITAVPFGEGTALISAIYGGGQLSYFVGWIVVSILDQCLFVSLAELCSKFPTSAGPVSRATSMHLRKSCGLLTLASTTSHFNCFLIMAPCAQYYPSSPVGLG